MHSTKNEPLGMIKIKQGYYLCQDSINILDWLKKNPAYEKKFKSINTNDTLACPIIVNDKGSIDAYFIFKEVLNDEVQYMLFFIPAFVSKKFNLLALHIRYKQMDIGKFYRSIYRQLNKITASVNHLFPVYGYCEEDFVGFFYLPEMFLCQN